MTIQDYIRDQVFGRRVQEHNCLVIYDPVRRYGTPKGVSASVFE